MAARSGKRVNRVPNCVLHNLSSVDILYEEVKKRKRNKILGVFQDERLIDRRRDKEVNNGNSNAGYQTAFLLTLTWIAWTSKVVKSWCCNYKDFILVYTRKQIHGKMEGLQLIREYTETRRTHLSSFVKVERSVILDFKLG